MSYSWNLGGHRGRVPPEALGSAAVEVPLTPPSVRNVTPSTCLSMMQFRALMQEYRSLDDSVTTRLNRTLSTSRTSGMTASPSILSRHVSSNDSLDLGKSTYATAPEQACLSFWRELVDVWIGREEVLSYCMQVEERERLKGIQAMPGEEWLLNNDVERQRRQSAAINVGSEGRQRKTDSFDSRASRSEDSADTLRRQMRNEFAVEAIIRKRSLDDVAFLRQQFLKAVEEIGKGRCGVVSLLKQPTKPSADMDGLQ